MSNKNHRFSIRHDGAFMADIEGWRSKQRPIPSRAEAMRLLVYRGLAVEDYLGVVLRQSANSLAEAGVIGPEAKPEIYERFQRFIVSNLDLAARLRRFPKEAQDPNLPSVLREIFSTQEMPDLETPACKTQSDSH